MFIKIKDVIIDTEYITHVIRSPRPMDPYQPSNIFVYTTNSSTAISIDFETYHGTTREFDRLADVLMSSE